MRRDIFMTKTHEKIKFQISDDLMESINSGDFLKSREEGRVLSLDYANRLPLGQFRILKDQPQHHIHFVIKKNRQ